MPKIYKMDAGLAKSNRKLVLGTTHYEVDENGIFECGEDAVEAFKSAGHKIVDLSQEVKAVKKPVVEVKPDVDMTVPTVEEPAEEKSVEEKLVVEEKPVSHLAPARKSSSKRGK